MQKNFLQQLRRSDIYFVLLVLIAASLPLSIFTISLFTILLGLNWLIEGNFKEKFLILRRRKSVVIFLTIYLIHIVGLLITEDFNYGLKDLRIKLPIFLFPLIIGTSKSLEKRQLKLLLSIFISAVLISTFASIYVLLGFSKIEVIDIRNISVFIRHIPFAILINIAIFSGLYFLLFKRDDINKKEKICIIITTVWLSVFLIILKSFTGIIIYVICGYLTLIFSVKWFKRKILKSIIKVSLILVPIFIILYVTFSYLKFKQTEKIDFDNLDTKTASGNKYYHLIDNKSRENGHFVWIYFSGDEISKEWEKVSKLKYFDKDKKGQVIRYTLTRYMTSKGLRKDSVGFSQLTVQDIKNIENGMTNYIYTHKFKLYPRLYEIFWEIEKYQNGSNPSGHSVTQRIEYLKTAISIIKDNFWIGTGTGDVKESFKEKYKELNSELDKKWQLRTHNQVVTFFLTFGIIGFLWILFATLFPISYEKKWRNYLFIIVFIMFSISMINEDTIETHVGVSMVAYFYSLFLFGVSNNENEF